MSASPLLASLVELLRLERLEENIFRGQSQDMGTGRVFGGQVFGQAISAVQQTCFDRSVHSAHAYFLRPGDETQPIIYFVENTRDGTSYSARTVTAIQKGKPIFTLLCSLQTPEEGDFDYCVESAAAPPSDGLITIDLENEGIDTHKHRGDRSKILSKLPFHVKLFDPAGDDQSEAERYWIRTSADLPDDDQIHKPLLAFASDFRLLPSTLRAVGYRYRVDETMMATICHAIWFHRRARVDDWLYYRAEPLSLSNGRGVSRGEIYDPSGELVASTMQEGVVRKLRSRPVE